MGDSKGILTAIKGALKRRRMSYRELGKRIGLTESGVKKLLGGDDISLNRLTRIAAIVGVSVAELVKDTENRDFTDVAFSPTQEAFFLAHRDYFNFYWKLVYERWSVAEIEKRFGLTSRASFRYLRKLDQLGLIHLGAEGKIRIPQVQGVRWVGSGPLVRQLYKEWSSRLMSDVARPDPGGDDLFVIRYLKVRRRTYEELVESMRAVEEEFVKRCTREMVLYSEGLETVRFIAAADRKSFVPSL